MAITLTVTKYAAALAEWDSGRCASPSPLDYVLMADEALRETVAGYEAPTFDPMPFETIADEMSDAMDDGETLADLEEMATYAVARLLGCDVTPTDLAHAREAVIAKL